MLTYNYTITDEALDYIIKITKKLDKTPKASVLEKMPEYNRVLKLKEINALSAMENYFADREKIINALNEKIFFNRDWDYMENGNLSAAFGEFSALNYLSLKDFLFVNEIIEKKLSIKAGKLRTINENIDDNFCYTPVNFIKNQLNLLFDFLKKGKANVLIKSILFCIAAEQIRPFFGGNEKSRFFWFKLILRQFDEKLKYAPVCSVIRNKFEDYKNITLKALTKGQLTSYILFMLGIIDDAVTQMLEESSDYSFYISNRVDELMRVIQPYPLSLPELMERLKLKSRDGFRKNYIVPAIKAGLIAMTEPEKPTSKNQRYYKL